MYEIALNILKKLNSNGFEAYIVGGYPRDKYLNIESYDIDICTSAYPSDIEKLFDNVDTKYKNYGNSIIIIDNYKFEVTTFRKEKYLKNRNDVEIEFVDDLETDLKRRDFTINTICIDKEGNYIDLLNGKNDIENKVIKLIGDISRLKDDPLRILRAIRFSSNLNFELDDYLKDGITEYGYLIANLSKNKVSLEINKMKDTTLLNTYNLDKYIEKD